MYDHGHAIVPYATREGLTAIRIEVSLYPYVVDRSARWTGGCENPSAIEGARSVSRLHV